MKWHYHTSCLELINKAILLTHEVYVRLLYLIKCLISPAHQVCFVLLLTFLKYLKIFSPYKLILMLVTIETNILSDKFTWWLKKKKKKKTNVTRRDVSKRKKPNLTASNRWQTLQPMYYFISSLFCITLKQWSQNIDRE